MIALALATGLLLSVQADTPKSDEEPIILYDYDPESIHAEVIERLVERRDPAGVSHVVRAVKRGLPPEALRAFLSAAAKHPHPAYLPELERLVHYRRPEVRARALLALASTSPRQARRAALLAMDDPLVGIRLLGVDLARRYTTPDLEEAALRLIARDPEVAALLEQRLGQ